MSNLMYCESNRRPNEVEKLADEIIRDIRKNPDFFKQEFVSIDGDYRTYTIRFSVIFNNQKFEVVMYYGTISPTGEMYVEFKSRIISSADLPDDVICMVWDEATSRLPPEDFDELFADCH